MISSSPVLAARDGKSVRLFLKTLGLTIGIIPEEGNPDKVELYKHPIVYGSIGQFQGDYLRTVYLDQPGRGDRPFDTC